MIGILEEKNNGASDVLAQNLEAYYKFNDNGAEALEVIQNANGVNTGILAGEPGLKNLSYYCDGTANKITVDKNDIFSFVKNGENLPFGISIWVKPDQKGVNQWLIEKRNNSSPADYNLYITPDNTIACQIRDTGNVVGVNLVTDKVFKDYTWNHIVLTSDGVNVDLYLNNVRKTAVFPAGFVMAGNTSGICFTNPPWTTSYNIKGSIDEWAFWKYKYLTTEEVYRLFANGNGSMINYNSTSLPDITQPKNITFSGETEESAVVNFDPVANALFYEIYLNGSRYQNFNNPGETLTGLIPETTYNVGIKAVGEYGVESAVSGSVYLTTLAKAPYPTAGLISMYEFEQTSGGVIDSWGTNNGVNYGATRGVSGKFGNCFLFTTSRIEIPNPGITNKVSFSCWLKLDRHLPLTDSATGIGDFNTKDSHSHYPYTDGKIYLSLFTSVRKTITTSVIPDRTIWHMFTITADAVLNEWKFYLNDQLVHTSTVGTLNVYPTMILGRAQQSGVSYYLKGLMDSPHFRNEVLTLSEIQYLFNNGNGRTL